jgi:hypothetical protein
MIRKNDLLIRLIECENRIEILEDDNESLAKKLKKLEKSLKEISKEEK